MSRKKAIRLEDVVHLMRRMPTRKVLVRMYGRHEVFRRKDIVLEVPAELTDEEVTERLQDDSENLPWPSHWEELDEREIDLPQDTSEAEFAAFLYEQSPLSEVVAVVYSGEVGSGHKADARLVVDEDGDQEIVS